MVLSCLVWVEDKLIWSLGNGCRSHVSARPIKFRTTLPIKIIFIESPFNLPLFCSGLSILFLLHILGAKVVYRFGISFADLEFHVVW